MVLGRNLSDHGAGCLGEWVPKSAGPALKRNQVMVLLSLPLSALCRGPMRWRTGDSCQPGKQLRIHDEHRVQDIWTKAIEMEEEGDHARSYTAGAHDGDGEIHRP